MDLNVTATVENMGILANVKGWSDEGDYYRIEFESNGVYFAVEIMKDDAIMN